MPAVGRHIPCFPGSERHSSGSVCLSAFVGLYGSQPHLAPCTSQYPALSAKKKDDNPTILYENYPIKKIEWNEEVT